ncbi:hypothetical protein SAMN04487971_10953 [Paracoccus chinensis]|uniref:Uncharacterized protein n=1 Tax=Paracoccus chinensis TaxID=525640 RepID=A0A1G9JA64_9RHOB|nr:hypothetical protein SAMN04487971_10953 [Paracoccus chinensis]
MAEVSIVAGNFLGLRSARPCMKEQPRQTLHQIEPPVRYRPLPPYFAASTAWARSSSSGTISVARRWVEARTTCGAANSCAA